MTAVGLEQIGELEGAEIAASFADFALEVSDDPAQVLWGEAVRSYSNQCRSRSKPAPSAACSAIFFGKTYPTPRERTLLTQRGGWIFKPDPPLVAGR